jgi:hypothetical protein
VQYCASGSPILCDTTAETNWTTLATVTNNDKVWKTLTFAPVSAKAIRVRVTRAVTTVAPATTGTPATRGGTTPATAPTALTTAAGPARITEIEAWE